MRFGVGVVAGFFAGLMAASALFAKTEKIFETGTFYKLQICKQERDELINEVGQYVRAIQQVAGKKENAQAWTGREGGR